MTLAKSLLNNHPDIEVYFITDKEWEGKLAKFDDRFKFSVIDYDNSEQKNHIGELLNKFEDSLKLPLLERSTVSLFATLLEDKTTLQMDTRAGGSRKIICLLIFTNSASAFVSVHFFRGEDQGDQCGFVAL